MRLYDRVEACSGGHIRLWEAVAAAVAKMTTGARCNMEEDKEVLLVVVDDEVCFSIATRRRRSVRAHGDRFGSCIVCALP
jgi:hypothetical protein